jgi:hypothetical protein
MPVRSHPTASVADLQTQALIGDAWSTDIVPRLPSDLEEQAKILKAFQRKRGISCPSDLLRGLLAYALEGFSTRTWGAWALLIGLADISDRAWCARLRLASPWLLWLLGQLLAAQVVLAPVQPGLKRRIRLIDTTRLAQVGGTGDDWRVHLSYNLLQARMGQVFVSDYHTAERLSHFDVEAGDILVADGGYGYRGNLAYVKGKGGDVVLRIHPRTFPVFDDTGKPFDVLAWLTGTRAQLVQWQGWCEHNRQRIPVRLVASKLPPQKVRAAQERKKRKAKKSGRKLSPEALLLAGWWLLVTTLSAQEWSASEVVGLYQARWQIELVFKRIKQLLKLRAIRLKDTKAVEAWIRALLVGWALQEQIAGELREMFGPLAKNPHAPASSWVLAQLVVETLRSSVRGTWTLERLVECGAGVVRFVVSSRRGRRQQEAAVREWLLKRFATPPPLQQAA